MGSLYWTKRTPLTKANMDTMVANDFQNYIGIVTSQAAIIGFKYSFSGQDYTGTNWVIGDVGDNTTYPDDRTISHHWHVVSDLSINGLQMTDAGLYRISAYQPQVMQVNSNLAAGPEDPDIYTSDGWEVGLRMDGKTYLTTQIYAQSGHAEPAIPEAYLRIYRPEKHTFQVVIRPYKDGWPTTAINRAALTALPAAWPQATPTDRVIWGDADNAGSDNRQLTGYHMVQFLGT